MPILRTAHCDICHTEQTEPDYGIGWAGWVTISGVGNHVDGQPHKHSDSNAMLCPVHGGMVADLLNDMETHHNLSIAVLDKG